MRWVVILVVLAVVLMFLGGWLYFRDTGDTSEIILDKQKVREDTEQAVEKGKELMESAAEGMQDLGQRAEETVSEEPPAEEAVSDQPVPEEPAPEEQQPERQPTDPI
jgi:hypothetical protein